jgi:hypothetical protein
MYPGEMVKRSLYYDHPPGDSDNWSLQMSRHAFNCQIAKFNTLAKPTHARYGTIKLPATPERRKNSTVVARIASHSITISTNAQPG